MVPAGHSWQWPAPSQSPVCAQLERGWKVHWSSGSVPAAAMTQRPTKPGMLHDRHKPLQGLWQHTPWAQTFDWHWPLALHGCPSANWPQLELMHTTPAAHPLARVQLVVQAVALAQTYGSQSAEVAEAAQVPWPSQARA